MDRRGHSMIDWKKVAIFAGGTLFGTAGIRILASDDAKKAYTQCVAAVLRGKKCVLDTVDTVQENCDDILSDAKALNEEREAKKDAAVFDDLSEEIAGVEEAAETAEA